MLENGDGGNSAPRGRAALASLRHRNFRLIWAGQIGRGLAWWLQAVVLAPWILQIGGGPIDLGIVAALQFGPVLVLAPLGGVLSDSLPRARVLPALQLVMAAISVAFFAMAVAGQGAMTWIFVLSLLFGIANAAEMPVRQSFIAEIVPRDDLLNAIGLNQLAFNLTRVIGPVLGGILVVTLGLSVAFAAAAAASVTVAILTSRIDVDESARPAWRSALPCAAPALATGGRHSLHAPLVLWPLALLGLVGIAGGGFPTG